MINRRKVMKNSEIQDCHQTINPRWLPFEYFLLIMHQWQHTFWTLWPKMYDLHIIFKSMINSRNIMNKNPKSKMANKQKIQDGCHFLIFYWSYINGNIIFGFLDLKYVGFDVLFIIIWWIEAELWNI